MSLAVRPVAHSDYQEVPPGGTENGCHLLDYALQPGGEPFGAAINDEHDGVGVAKIGIQHLRHLLYELIIAVGGVSKARGVHHSELFPSSQPKIIPDGCFRSAGFHCKMADREGAVIRHWITS